MQEIPRYVIYYLMLVINSRAPLEVRTNMGIVPIITYLSVIVFVVSVVTRFIKLSSLPVHLRWEVYPVPHEKGKGQYGGSYLEDYEWWTKPRQTSKMAELKVMLSEIILLAGVWEHNKKHWFRTFPFHFGLYLLAGLIVLLAVGGAGSAFGLHVVADGGVIGALIYYFTIVLGYAGLVLALIGSLALLARRTFNADYREYTTGADFFNLLFFIATLVLALFSRFTADLHFDGLRGFFKGLLTLNGSAVPQLTTVQSLEIVFASLLMAYIPLTHMSHFFTKWFTYHDVRWSDEPNLPGSGFDEKIAKQLEATVDWSAPHIRGDGKKKNWIDVVTSSGREE
jgi:nitrate reductase gamma subunit